MCGGKGTARRAAELISVSFEVEDKLAQSHTVYLAGLLCMQSHSGS